MDQQKIRKIEFGVATGIFLLALFSLIGPSLMNGDIHYERYNMGGIPEKFARYHQIYDYYLHYFLPVLIKIVVIYLSFLLVNFIVVPKLLEKNKWVLGGLLILSTVTFMFFLLMVSNSYRYGYMLGQYKTIRGAHMQFAKMAFRLTVAYTVFYTVYYAIKQIYFTYGHSYAVRKIFPNKIAREVLIAFAVWVVLLVTINDWRLSSVIMFFFPVAAALFFFTQYKIYPEFETHKNKAKLTRDLIIYILAINFVVMMMVLIIWGNEIGGDPIVPFALVGVLLSATVGFPLSWFFFKSQLNQKAVTGLKVALGQSSANLDFLRTQINPHFLFNALNTLYGTALQEDAPRTSEGIQKLGDMMRFMLHDNHLEKISLEKEVAYLQNYIDLQRLRVMESPDIKIEVNINETDCTHEIAPMLLIPFVENAFKHGISLRNRSSIVISLSCTATEVFFDVYNTVHARPENDPERDSMGIGLNNVRERLALLYPGKHDLSIRQTSTGFFVHLTIVVN
ncbi:sensor histidine kinase [Chitinophaga sp. Cy-1792]|uniref:sensor histidine kinase n=1 Tax=Chitinophaga sp. Cy-1792 TaxID=2608339 RepID=UPI0014223427|nr:histidine kinase [Chitinophaga sp. Cy-1792]NIG53686.1 sensor histidine kinase [Chitinophaga sp. Cy-1792]